MCIISLLVLKAIFPVNIKTMVKKTQRPRGKFVHHVGVRVGTKNHGAKKEGDTSAIWTYCRSSQRDLRMKDQDK